MGTVERRAREKDAKRRAILRAAIRCFARKGYASVSLDDVARAAEVAKGTVYLYFKSKADLFASLLLDHGFEPFSDALEASLARCKDAAGALRAFTRCFRDLCLGGDREIFQLFVQLDRGDVAEGLSENLREESHRRLEGILDSLAKWIDRGRAEGLLACPEGRRVARVLWAVCVGVAHLARGGESDGARVLDDAVEGLLAGLASRKRA